MLRARSLFIVVILLLCSFNIYSQTVFREGYIIKKNGSYIEGLIGYVSGKKIPDKCVFKSFEIAVPVSYTADMLKSFGYENGQRYESVSVNGKNEFYEILVYGNLSLFRSNSGYHIRKDGFQIIDLETKRIEWKDENGEKIFNNKEELMNFLSEGNGNKKENITAVVTAYNTRSGSKSVSYVNGYSEKEIMTNAVQTGAGRSKKGVIAGVNQYSLHLEARKSGYCPSPESETGFVFGLTYENIISKRNNRLSLRSDVLFLKQTFYTYQEVILPDGRTSIDDSFFDFSSIRLPLLLQYSFNGRKLRPFFNTGLTGSCFIKKDYLHINEKQSRDYYSIFTTEDNDFKFRFAELSFSAGAGIRLNIAQNLQLSLEGRIEAGSGLFRKEVPGNTLKQYSVQPGFFCAIIF